MEVQSKFYWGIFLILISILVMLLKRKILDIKESTDDELYSKENRNIHELRAWMVIISFFAFGLWLLVKDFF